MDALAKAVDQSRQMGALDQFEAQALNLLTSPAAREAFDLGREPDRVRDRNGRHQWGQQCLMARRLVEAGVEIVTTTLDGPLCGRGSNWDDHVVNHPIFEVMKSRAQVFDPAVTALIEGIFARGLDQRVLVIVTGEFGRTPRITEEASGGGAAGRVQPGRDHCPGAFSQLWVGGGIDTGRVIGATYKRGEEVVDRRRSTGDFLATIYRHLVLDALEVALPDFFGRPQAIFNEGAPIPELKGKF